MTAVIAAACAVAFVALVLAGVGAWVLFGARENMRGYPRRKR
jgi:hypothetical protein